MVFRWLEVIWLGIGGEMWIAATLPGFERFLSIAVIPNRCASNRIFARAIWVKQSISSKLRKGFPHEHRSTEGETVRRRRRQGRDAGDVRAAAHQRIRSEERRVG